MNLQDCLDFLKHINRSFIVAWEGNTVLLKLHWAARLLIQPASSITPLSFSHSKLLHSPKTNWFCARRTQANTHAHTQRIVYIHAAALRAEGQDTSERVDGGDRESRTDNESWPKCEWKANGKEKKVKNQWGVDKKIHILCFMGATIKQTDSTGVNAGRFHVTASVLHRFDVSDERQAVSQAKQPN